MQAPECSGGQETTVTMEGRHTLKSSVEMVWGCKRQSKINLTFQRRSPAYSLCRLCGIKCLELWDALLAKKWSLPWRGVVTKLKVSLRWSQVVKAKSQQISQNSKGAAHLFIVFIEIASSVVLLWRKNDCWYGGCGDKSNSYFETVMSHENHSTILLIFLRLMPSFYCITRGGMMVASFGRAVAFVLKARRWQQIDPMVYLPCWIES